MQELGGVQTQDARALLLVDPAGAQRRLQTHIRTHGGGGADQFGSGGGDVEVDETFIGRDPAGGTYGNDRMA